MMVVTKAGADPAPAPTPAKIQPRAEPVGKPSAGSLKERIPQQEGAEDPAELNLAQMVFDGNGGSRDGDVHAIEERNSAQDEQPEDEVPADIAMLAVRHGSTVAKRPAPKSRSQRDASRI